MKIHTFGILWMLPLMATAQPASVQPDLAKIAADVARYESGGNMEPLRAIDALVRATRDKPDLRKPLETALASILTGNSTFEGKRFACQNLGIIGSEESLPALAGLLERDETVGIACLALGSYPSAKANSVLRDALATRKGAARAQIINTLGDRRDASSVELLAGLAHDADPAVAEAAVAALAKIGDAPARTTIASLRRENAPALANALTDASLRIAGQLAASGDHEAAATAYEEFCQPSQPTHLRRAAFAALLRLDADGGEKRILAAIHGQDTTLKPIAIAGVASLKSGGTSEKFAAEIVNLDPVMQVLMIGAMAARGDDGARRAITSEVQNANQSVAMAAIRALGALGDATSVPALAKVATRREESELTGAALASLQQLKGTAASEAILAAAKEAPPEARVRLMGVLLARQTTQAVPFLIEQASHEDAKVAAAAFRGLGKLSEPKQLPALVEMLANLRRPEIEKDACGAVVQVARRIADPARRSDEILVAYRKTDAATARCAMLGALAETAGPQALDAALAATEDRDQKIRDAATRALANWSDPSATPRILAKADSAPDTTSRILLLRGCIRLLGLPADRPKNEMLADYATALRLATRPEEKRMVIAALAATPLPGSLGIVAPLLDDAALQTDAALAVVRIIKANPGTDREQAKAILPKAAAIAKDPAQQREASELLKKLK